MSKRPVQANKEVITFEINISDLRGALNGLMDEEIKNIRKGYRSRTTLGEEVISLVAKQLQGRVMALAPCDFVDDARICALVKDMTPCIAEMDTKPERMALVAILRKLADILMGGK